MNLRIALIFLFAGVAVGADGQALVDRVGTTGFVQLQAESFKALSPRQQSLAFYLSQASIAIDPINYDQNSRFGLRQKRLLEALVKLPPGRADADSQFHQAVLGQSGESQ